MTRERKVEKLLEIARSLIGAPYKYGAYLEVYADNQTAFDCSSFLQYVFKQISINIPRSTILQAAADGKEIIYPEIVMPGDVIFFEGKQGHYRHDLFPADRKIYIGHAALSVGSSRIIHATNNSTASGVIEQSVITLPESYNVTIVKRFF